MQAGHIIKKKKAGTPLRKARLLRDQTQVEVAAAVEINPSYYSRIESGSVRATPELARKLEEHFGHAVSRMQILYPEDYPPAPTSAHATIRSP